MLAQLCQNIRDLTAQAAALVEDNQIELCLSILIQRQNLLDELAQYQQFSPDKNPENTSIFIELIKWVQQEDAINSKKVVCLRAQNKQKSVTQVKINKALHHYKKNI
jgi:hypothetical protein